MHSSTWLVVVSHFFWARNIKKHLKLFTLIMHPRCHFRPMLTWHRNHPIGYQIKPKGWFLCNGNTGNLRHQLFHILFLTLLKMFFTPFSKCLTKSNLFHKYQRYKMKNYLTITTNNFNITRALIKLILTPLLISWNTITSTKKEISNKINF